MIERPRARGWRASSRRRWPLLRSRPKARQVAVARLPPRGRRQARPNRPGTKRVTYQGITLAVPARWPVYRLAANPTRCVRFDKNAVYLGPPSENQNCPARILGQVAAVLVQPLDAAGVNRAMSRLKPAVVDGQPVAVAIASAVQPAYKMVSRRAHAEVVVTSGTNSTVANAVTASIRISAAPARSGRPSSAGPPGCRFSAAQLQVFPSIPAQRAALRSTAGAPSTLVPPPARPPWRRGVPPRTAASAYTLAAMRPLARSPT